MSAKPTPDRFDGFEAVPVEITVRIGSCRTTLARLARLKPGEELMLDRTVGEAFDLLAEGRPVARVEPIACEETAMVKVVAAVPEDPR